jgi:hypothetical protein
LALLDKTLCLMITYQAGANSRPRFLAKYTTDLDFADGIMLILDNAVKAPKQLNSVDVMASWFYD